MENNVAEVQSPKLPVSHGFFAGLWAGIKAMLAELAKPEFYITAFKIFAMEFLHAGAVAAGGVLLYYGKRGKNKEIMAVTESMTQPGASAVATKAFGGQGFIPTPTYNPSGSYPVPVTPTGDSRFPGFGSR